MNSTHFDPKAILAEVRVNHAKLDACSRHDFVGMPDGAIRCNNGILYRKYRCTRCDGRVDSHAADWYRLGRNPPRPRLHADRRTDAQRERDVDAIGDAIGAVQGELGW